VTRNALSVNLSHGEMTKTRHKLLAHGAWVLTLVLLATSVVMGLAFGTLPLTEAPVGLALALFSVMGATSPFDIPHIPWDGSSARSGRSLR
jgi:hypothetical protein